MGHLHHGVVGEVGLLHHAVHDIDLAPQSGRQAEDNRAFHLLGHESRVDHRAAVNGTDHTVHAGHPVLHRNFCHFGDDGAKGLVQSNATGTTGGKRAAPFGLFSRQVEHGQIAGRVFQKAAAQFQRIFVAGGGQLVDKALREKRVVRVADRAPEAHGDAHFGGHMRHALVGEAVRQVKQSFGRCFVRHVDGTGQQRNRPLHPARRNRVTCRFNAQALQLALGVQCGFESRGVHGAVKVVAHVFLAGPGQLHRLAARGLGHLDGLGNKVHLQTATKATAQQGDVHGHVALADARSFGGRVARRRWNLRRRPNFNLAVFDLGRAVHGLHGGVGQVRCGVAGFNGLRSGFFCRINVAPAMKSQTTLFVELVLQFGGDVLGIQSTLAALLPLRLHRLSAFSCMPCGFGHYSKTGTRAVQGLQGHDLQNAWQGQGGCRVQGTSAAAKHGRHAHARKHHVRHANVQAKLGAAIGFAEQIGAGRRRAQELPRIAVFGHHLGRWGACGSLRKFTVMAGLARGVLQYAFVDGNFRGRHLPLCRRRAHQTGPGRGRCQAQGLPCVRNARRTARRNQTQLPREFAHHPFACANGGGVSAIAVVERVKRQTSQQHGHVAVDRVGAGLFQMHLVQCHIELLGHQHGQAGVDALSHFAAGHGQYDRAILRDLDPTVQRDRVLGRQHVCRGARARARRHGAPAYDQGAGGAQGAQYPGTAFHAVTSFTGVDGCASAVPVARWMAARTRW